MIADTSNCHFFRWRQYSAIRDQKRRFLPRHGVPAAGLHDPQPPDDDKSWYLTDAERAGMQCAYILWPKPKKLVGEDHHG
jgi:hypothetical protein